LNLSTIIMDNYENQMKFLSTDIIQFLLNDENNNFYDRNMIDVIKKQRCLINNLCINSGLNQNFIQDSRYFKGMPGDFEKEKIKVRKFFIENQASPFDSMDIEKLKTIKSLMVRKNFDKIKKYLNIKNFIHSKECEENMKNNLDLFKFLFNHPFVKVMDEKFLHEFSTKYSILHIETIKSLMKDNSSYKYSDDNSHSSNTIQDGEYEEDDYNEDEEFYDSADDLV
jgi:hypothetical protein